VNVKQEHTIQNKFNFSWLRGVKRALANFRVTNMNLALVVAIEIERSIQTPVELENAVRKRGITSRQGRLLVNWTTMKHLNNKLLVVLHPTYFMLYVLVDVRVANESEQLVFAANRRIKLLVYAHFQRH
jgi:hypothetical protein